MRKTYETKKQVNLYKLTFIKTFLTGKDWVRFKLTKFRSEDVNGFSKSAEMYVQTRGGNLNILSGAIEENGCHTRIKKEDFSFVRKQWLKHKEDFLKGK